MADRPCKRCGAPLIFARGPNGKDIPLDARPQVRVYAVVDQPDGTRAAVPVAGHYVTHFATCAFAAEFSRKKKPGGRAPGEEG